MPKILVFLFMFLSSCVQFKSVSRRSCLRPVRVLIAVSSVFSGSWLVLSLIFLFEGEC